MKRNEIKLGAILSYVTIFLNTVITLFYTPLLLRYLGQSEYGLYMLMGSFVSYISVLDLGLHNTIYRFIAKYQAKKESEEQENFLASIFIIYGIITILVLIVGIILYCFLDQIFASSLTEEELAKAHIMFIILIFNLATALPLGAFQYIIKGYGRFVFDNSITIIKIILRTIALVVLIISGFKSVTIVIVDTIFNFAMGGTFLLYCFLKLDVRIKLHRLNKKVIEEIFGYSICVFILAIVNQFFWKLGQVTLGITSSTYAVAVYALAINLVMYYQQFSLSISGVFMPKLSVLIANGATDEELTKLMIKVGRIQFTVLGLVLSGFTTLGKTFILLWAGPDYDQVYFITLIIFLSLTIPMIQTIANVIIQVTNMQAFKAKVYLTMTGVNIIITILLGRTYGALGVAFSTGLCTILFQIIIMNLFYKYKLGLNIGKFFKEVSRGIVPVIIGTTILGYLTNFLPGSGWGGMLIQVSLISLSYLILLYRFGLSKMEKYTYIYPILNKLKNNIYMLAAKLRLDSH